MPTFFRISDFRPGWDLSPVAYCACAGAQRQPRRCAHITTACHLPPPIAERCARGARSRGCRRDRRADASSVAAGVAFTARWCERRTATRDARGCRGHSSPWLRAEYPRSGLLVHTAVEAIGVLPVRNSSVSPASPHCGRRHLGLGASAASHTDVLTRLVQDDEQSRHARSIPRTGGKHHREQ